MQERPKPKIWNPTSTHNLTFSCIPCNLATLPYLSQTICESEDFPKRPTQNLWAYFVLTHIFLRKVLEHQPNIGLVQAKHVQICSSYDWATKSGYYQFSNPFLTIIIYPWNFSYLWSQFIHLFFYSASTVISHLCSQWHKTIKLKKIQPWIQMIRYLPFILLFKNKQTMLVLRINPLMDNQTL